MTRRRDARTRMEELVFLIQLLLPTSQTETGALRPLTETRQELSERFNGPNAYVRGSANDPDAPAAGHLKTDGDAMVEVVTETFDRDWWRAYARTLAARFNPGEVRLRTVPIELPDEA